MMLENIHVCNGVFDKTASGFSYLISIFSVYLLVSLIGSVQPFMFFFFFLQDECHQNDQPPIITGSCPPLRPSLPFFSLEPSEQTVHQWLYYQLHGATGSLEKALFSREKGIV